MKLAQHHQYEQDEYRDPSPEEIREECRRIREDWDEATRRRRCCYKPQRWTIPQTDSVAS